MSAERNPILAAPAGGITFLSNPSPHAQAGGSCGVLSESARIIPRLAPGGFYWKRLTAWGLLLEEACAWGLLLETG
jgi:hypothetical protein